MSQITERSLSCKFILRRFSKVTLAAIISVCSLSFATSGAQAQGLLAAEQRLNQACQQLRQLLNNPNANLNSAQALNAKARCADAIGVFRPAYSNFGLERIRGVLDPTSLLSVYDEIEPSLHKATERERRHQEYLEESKREEQMKELGRRWTIQAAHFGIDVFGGGTGLSHNSPGLLSGGLFSGIGFDTPNYKSDGWDVGALGWFDAGRFLNFGANQKLRFYGFVSHARADTDLGVTPGTSFGNNGTASSETLHYGGAFGYGIENVYVTGLIAGRSSNQDVQSFTAGYTGSYDTNGTSADLRLGTVIPLWRPARAVYSGMPTKSAPALASNGLRSLWLDVSGHWGHDHDSGLNFSNVPGDARVKSYDIYGAAAKLYAPMAWNDLPYTIFAGVSFDRLSNYEDRLTIPGITFNFQEGRSFWGLDGGANVLLWGDSTLKANVYYKTSSDSDLWGGGLTLKIPLGAGKGPVVAKY